MSPYAGNEVVDPTHRAREVEAGELVHPRAVQLKRFQQPVVRLPSRLELQRADRVVHVLQAAARNVRTRERITLAVKATGCQVVRSTHKKHMGNVMVAPAAAPKWRLAVVTIVPVKAWRVRLDLQAAVERKVLPKWEMPSLRDGELK